MPLYVNGQQVKIGEKERHHRVGTLIAGTVKEYKCDCNVGDWLVLSTYDRPSLYKNDGTMVENLNVFYANGVRKPRIYCDGSWDYAKVTASNNDCPPKISDGTLILGDSYVHGALPNALGDELSKQFISGSWAKGQSGYTAEYLVGLILNIGEHGMNETGKEQYDAVFINAWRDGIFSRCMIWCGANRVNHGTTSNPNYETLEENKIEESIPKVTSGTIADLLNGGTMTVNGQTVSTVSAYHSLFSKNTIGQYAFLIEYLQALQPLKPIYCMGYILWDDNHALNNSDFVIGICEQLEKWYGVKFINSFKDMGLNRRNTSPYKQSDGIHPNQEGSKLYWEKVLERNTII